MSETVANISYIYHHRYFMQINIFAGCPICKQIKKNIYIFFYLLTNRASCKNIYLHKIAMVVNI